MKAILINGLGFVSRPLYLFSQFFQDKGIEILLGSGVKSEYIVEKLLKELKKEDFETPEQARYKVKGINSPVKEDLDF